MGKTPEEVKALLTEKLNLADPEFDLEELPGGRLSGTVVSDTFCGMEDAERQRQIWGVLDAEYGAESTQIVGTLLAFTKAEWNIALTDD